MTYTVDLLSEDVVRVQQRVRALGHDALIFGHKTKCQRVGFSINVKLT